MIDENTEATATNPVGATGLQREKTRIQRIKNEGDSGDVDENKGEGKCGCQIWASGNERARSQGDPRAPQDRQR